MDKQTMHAMQQWMFKADHDLRSALKLKTPDSNEPLLDTAVYHCQQTAEKTLKAYLTANEIPFPKVHLLLPLLELCIDIDPSFSNIADAAELLTPFATEFRYPGDILEPTHLTQARPIKRQSMLSYSSTPNLKYPFCDFYTEPSQFELVEYTAPGIQIVTSQKTTLMRVVELMIGAFVKNGIKRPKVEKIEPRL